MIVNSGVQIDIPMTAIQDLCNELNECGIQYCNWKSNQHLDEALKGKTDLDLLVADNQIHEFREILFKHGCKPFLSPPGKAYPAIEDFLGFDRETGKLFHLHIHYRLIVGGRFMKNYRLPLEKKFLSSAILCQGVKIASPEMETIVLAIRALLKYRFRDFFKDSLSIKSPGLPQKILRELQYLLQETTFESISNTLQSEMDIISPEIVMDFLHTVEQSPRAGYKFYRLKKAMKRDLSAFQLYSPGKVLRKYLTVAYGKKLPFFRSWFGKKKPLSGGVIIALIGADGSGKSTSVSLLYKWLSWKLDTKQFYMGSGEKLPKTSNALRITSRYLARICSISNSAVGKRNPLSGIFGKLYRFNRYLYYVSMAVTRYRRYQDCLRNAAEGRIVICDRFPLAAIQRVMMNGSRPPMDGIRIAWRCEGENISFVTAWLSRLEQGLYKKMFPPDYLILLHVSAEVALKRKPNLPRREAETKIQAIESMDHDGLRIIDIDADQPLDETLLQIKNAVWNIL